MIGFIQRPVICPQLPLLSLLQIIASRFPYRHLRILHLDPIFCMAFFHHNPSMFFTRVSLVSIETLESLDLICFSDQAIAVKMVACRPSSNLEARRQLISQVNDGAQKGQEVVVYDYYCMPTVSYIFPQSCYSNLLKNNPIKLSGCSLFNTASCGVMPSFLLKPR